MENPSSWLYPSATLIDNTTIYLTERIPSATSFVVHATSGSYGTTAETIRKRTNWKIEKFKHLFSRLLCALEPIPCTINLLLLPWYLPVLNLSNSENLLRALLHCATMKAHPRAWGEFSHTQIQNVEIIPNRRWEKTSLCSIQMSGKLEKWKVFYSFSFFPMYLPLVLRLHCGMFLASIDDGRSGKKRERKKRVKREKQQ